MVRATRRMESHAATENQLGRQHGAADSRPCAIPKARKHRAFHGAKIVAFAHFGRGPTGRIRLLQSAQILGLMEPLQDRSPRQLRHARQRRIAPAQHLDEVLHGRLPPRGQRMMTPEGRPPEDLMRHKKRPHPVLPLDGVVAFNYTQP